jgi:hypothetical protein
MEGIFGLLMLNYYFLIQKDVVTCTPCPSVWEAPMLFGWAGVMPPSDRTFLFVMLLEVLLRSLPLGAIHDDEV